MQLLATWSKLLKKKKPCVLIDTPYWPGQVLFQRPWQRAVWNDFCTFRPMWLQTEDVCRSFRHLLISPSACRRCRVSPLVSQSLGNRERHMCKNWHGVRWGTNRTGKYNADIWHGEYVSKQLAYLEIWAMHNIKLVTFILKQCIKLQYCCLCRAICCFLLFFLVTLKKNVP